MLGNAFNDEYVPYKNYKVIKAKINNETLSQLLKTAPNLIDAIGTLSTTNETEKEIKEASDDMFGFITSSSLITSIKNNDFSGIIDMIKNISNDSDKIYVDIDLSSLGLGDNAEVNLVLNASRNEGEKVISIDVKNVVLSTVEINVSISSDKFSSEKINKVKLTKDSFDDLSFVPGIINQATTLLNDKRGLLEISGSIMDENNEGIVIDGAAQFDANINAGYGSLNLRQYGSDIINSNKYIDHTIDFDIDNNGDNNSDKNGLFVYNSELRERRNMYSLISLI